MPNIAQCSDNVAFLSSFNLPDIINVYKYCLLTLELFNFSISAITLMCSQISHASVHSLSH